MKKSLTERVQEVLLGLIDLPEYPDRVAIDPDYINELAESIRELGLLQPIILRPVNSRYELVAGHCRLLAYKALERGAISSIIKSLTDKEVVLARAVENLQRVNLTIIEEAKIYASMVGKLDMSVDEIAKKLGKSPGRVHRWLALLKIPLILQEAIHEGKIKYSIGEELNRLGNIGKIQYYLSWCIDHGAEVVVVRKWVDEEKAKERQALLDTEVGRGAVVIPRSLPVYVPCQLCTGPMVIGDECHIRCCHECAKKLNEMLKV